MEYSHLGLQWFLLSNRTKLIVIVKNRVTEDSIYQMFKIFIKFNDDSRLIWQGAAPCGPFRRFICALQSFWTLYMCPAAFSDPLYIIHVIFREFTEIHESFIWLYHGIPRSLKFLIANIHKTLICGFRIFGFSGLIVI